MDIVVRRLACLFMLGVIAGCEPPNETDPVGKAGAQATTKPDKEAASKLPSVKLEKGPFKIDVSVKGVVEAEQTTEIMLHPEAWTSDLRANLTVDKAVEHGSEVKKGDLLVALDLEKIDQTIRDQEADKQLAELGVKQAEEELPALEKSLPLDLESAVREKKVADEDLKKFIETDKPLSEKSATFSVTSAQHGLEYAKEELHQLEKMYRANDLREETEEIILKRQRHAVEAANFGLQTSLIHRDQTLKVDLPRQEQTHRERVLRQSVALDKARTTLPLQVSQKRLALEKLRYDRRKSVEQLQKLIKDRELLTVRSPADGIVYYGKCTHGQWSTSSFTSGKLQKGGNLSPDEVFMTIVKPRPSFIRVTIEEKELSQLKPGLTGKLIPTFDSERKLPATLESISHVPVSSGSFEGKAKLENSKEADALMPGMGCTIKFPTYVKEAALTVPSTNVFAEELDEDKRYVYLVKPDGKHEKHPVTVGRTAGNRIEILAGLKEGDEILLEKPADGKKADAPKK